MRNRFTIKDGFTLVEVMLALAIVSIGLIAILGLLPTGLRSARDAADNTISATVVQDSFSLMRNSPFHGAAICDTCATQDLATYNTIVNPAKQVTDYYDQAGFTTNKGNAYYRVVLDFEPQGALALTRIKATVVWPALSAHPANTNVFFTQIAQYNQ